MFWRVLSYYWEIRYTKEIEEGRCKGINSIIPLQIESGKGRICTEGKKGKQAVMGKKDRRRFSRINIQWAVQLDFGTVEYKRSVDNVSLGGFYIEGDFQQVMLGDVCTISLKQSGVFSEEVVRAVGSITRINEQGMAVEFLSMKLDSFFLLQTSLFYKASDPVLLGKEFIENNIFEIEGDLVFFQVDNVNVRTIRQIRNYLLRQE
jgi:hypothetical protein